MNKSGTAFKECIAHHYWHHMDDRKRFFKVMLGDFENGVTIPKKFVANIGEQLPEQVTLKVPNGKTYTVEVAKEQQNQLVLRSGWAEFVSAYELEQGDFLVFKNSGNSHLKVRIFDPSGCEKELSCILLDRVPCMQERKGFHGKQMQSPTGKRLAVGSPSSSRKTPKMNPIDSPSQKKRHVSPTKRHGVAKPSYVHPQHKSLTDEQRSKLEEKVGAIQSETPKMNPTASPSHKKRHVSPIKRHGVAKPPYMLPHSTSLTDEQKSRVEKKVRAIQSEIPVYVAVMTNSNVNRLCVLGISSAYAREYLPGGGGEKQLRMGVRLRRKHDAWEAEFQAKHGRQHIFGKGWRKFVTDNRLKPGHICLFNLRKNTKMLKMDVHIIRNRSV